MNIDQQFSVWLVWRGWRWHLYQTFSVVNVPLRSQHSSEPTELGLPGGRVLGRLLVARAPLHRPGPAVVDSVREVTNYVETESRD